MIEAQRVVARYQKVALAWDGKFLGRDARLRWNRGTWLLEELPQKGLKKLRSATLDNPSMRGWRGFDAYIPDNLLMDAKLSKSDDYDKIKNKLLDAFKAAADVTLERQDEDKKKHFQWLKDVKWYETKEHFLKIEPEETDPLKVEGKDFTLRSEWTEFKVYDPGADFQSHDPTYTMLYESSPAAARKLYKILAADPDALKNVSWSKLTDWLAKNRISYKTHFSQYR